MEAFAISSINSFKFDKRIHIKKCEFNKKNTTKIRNVNLSAVWFVSNQFFFFLLFNIDLRLFCFVDDILIHLNIPALACRLLDKWDKKIVKKECKLQTKFDLERKS